MKSFGLSIFIVCFALHELAAQTKVVSFTSTKEKGLSVADLDALYKSALHSDTSLAVFKTEGEQTKLIGAYQSFVREIGAYLKANGIKWDAPTRIFNRFYVGKSGEVEYYVYNFLSQSDQIGTAFTQKFEQLMTAFFETHKFDVTAEVPFSQCSPVVF